MSVAGAEKASDHHDQLDDKNSRITRDQKSVLTMLYWRVLDFAVIYAANNHFGPTTIAIEQSSVRFLYRRNPCRNAFVCVQNVLCESQLVNN